jgi:transposase
MLSLPPIAKIYLCTVPADMLKSFDGLCGLIRTWLQGDPLSGDVYVFRNKTGDRIKILTFEGDGLAIFYKRLEAGTFRIPLAVDDSGTVTARTADLPMLQAGVDLSSSYSGNVWRLFGNDYDGKRRGFVSELFEQTLLLRTRLGTGVNADGLLQFANT